MPQILEEAIYACYEDMGWDIYKNTNERLEALGIDPYDENVDSFPILSDLLGKMEQIVNNKGFSGQMRADYIGSLVSRLSNLTVGSKGSMLNCEHSTSFDYILNNNVILEMEELKSPEDKALLMGFVLSRLSAVIKAKHKEDNDFKHITLIEEAHRLLSKAEYGDSGSKKAAVETFTDLLAEVRKYGEGLIIVDQIPNKLASEVLKNTNTKIIHKILARDDKEAVGDTMLMDDKQKTYLSALSVGEAIVFSENTDKPVHVKINHITDTNEEAISDEIVIKRFQNYKNSLGGCYNDLTLSAMKVFGEFNRFVKMLINSRMKEANEKACLRLKNIVDEKSAELGINQRDFWRKLVKRRDRLSGKAIANAETIEERTDKLIDIYMSYISNTGFKDEEKRLELKKNINFL